MCKVNIYFRVRLTETVGLKALNFLKNEVVLWYILYNSSVYIISPNS